MYRSKRRSLMQRAEGSGPHILHPARRAFVNSAPRLGLYPWWRIAHGQIALRAGMAGVGRGQALSDGEAVAVGLQRLAQIALRHQHVADPVVGPRQIALPA